MSARIRAKFGALQSATAHMAVACAAMRDVDGGQLMRLARATDSRQARAVSAIGLHLTSVRDLCVRIIGGTWFIFLAFIVIWNIRTKISSSIYDLSLLSGFCLAIFYVILGKLIMTRPRAKAAASGLWPRIAAFVGTYLPCCITVSGRADNPVLHLISVVSVLIGATLMLVTIHYLGRSFSVIPQARTVVQSGPYRWIRHPLYLSEEISIIGVVLQYLSPISILILVLHIAIQLRRILYEEELLRRTLPEYAAYETSRWHLIPYVW